jgi:hypothetical protein
VLSGSIQTLIDDEEGVGPKGLNGGYVVNNGNPYYSDGQLQENLSGVGLGYGIDLAQQPPTELAAAGIGPPDSIAMTPYMEHKVPALVCPGPGPIISGKCIQSWAWALGPRGSNAQADLTKNGGLTVSLATVSAFDNYVFNQALTWTESEVPKYDGGTPFNELPAVLQDVLVSITFNGGREGFYRVAGDLSTPNIGDLSNLIQQDSYLSPARATQLAAIVKVAETQGDIPGDNLKAGMNTTPFCGGVQ